MGWALGAALVGLAMAGSAGLVLGEGAEYDIVDGMYHLTDANYETFAKEFSSKKKTASIIFISSQSCEECKQMDKNWAQVAENFENRTDVPVTFGTVDDSLYPSLAREHNVKSTKLPYGLMFEEGGTIVNPLSVPLRNIEGTAEYFRDTLKGAASNTTAAQLKKDLVSAKAPIVVHLVDNSTDMPQDEADAFELAAKKFRSQLKFQTIKEEFLLTASEIFGISENSFVVFMPQFWLGKGQKEHYYSVPFTSVDETIAWVDKHKIPLVAVHNQNNYNVLKGDTRPVLTYLSYNKNKKKRLQPTTDVLREVAKKFDGIRCAVDSRSATNAASFGHVDTPRDGHVLAIVNTFNLDRDGEYRLYYPYHGDLEVEAISAFVQSFLDGKAEMYLQTEKEFAVAETGVVQEVTSDTYDKLVRTDGYNSVLILCDNHIVGCEILRPLFDALASTLDKIDEKTGKSKLKFFWMSPTNNNLGEESLSPIGLPAMYFYKDGNKNNPSEYKGEFMFESMHSFVVGYMELQFFDDDDDSDDEF